MNVTASSKKPGAIPGSGTTQKLIRCAIYTRKSTDEGLNMEFNSLDAQREAAEAFILSQRQEGWAALPEFYDDGGFSGGTMERPALRRLLADVEARKVDAIVVYKVDRLSRSLMDFSRIMETLDRYGCSFVSVTQQFNTTHSMGRLTLNILLSFAQFEREIISERTRDKMRAARQKGKWVGGGLILGYDLDYERKRLVVNEDEAERVRAIFGLFLELRSVMATVQELNRRGWPRKTWTGKTGRLCGGGPWTKTNLHGLLANAHYAGKVDYQGAIFAGEQGAIVSAEVWADVQGLLAPRTGKGSAIFSPAESSRSSALLRGILKCGSCDCTMQPTYTSKGNTRYRYYVCQNAAKRGRACCPTRSIPAGQIEGFVVERIAVIGADRKLIAEVETQARKQRDERLVSLVAEKAQLEKALRQHARTIAALSESPRKPGPHTRTPAPDPTEQIAGLESQIRAAESRLAEIATQIPALQSLHISREGIARALANFREAFESLPPGDRQRLLSLLLETVVYDGPKGTVAISFRPTGIQTLNNSILPQS
ncbi:resolvase [Verrucomicrobia bacterium LW23]|nr:resolvase [Verrucomicrobia bacterium LW23]